MIAKSLWARTPDRRRVDGILYLGYVRESIRFFCETDVSLEVWLFEGELVRRDPEVLDYLRDYFKTDNPYPSEEKRTCEVYPDGPSGGTRERCVEEENQTPCQGHESNRVSRQLRMQVCPSGAEDDTAMGIEEFIAGDKGAGDKDEGAEDKVCGDLRDETVEIRVPVKGIQGKSLERAKKGILGYIEAADKQKRKGEEAAERIDDELQKRET